MSEGFIIQAGDIETADLTCNENVLQQFHVVPSLVVLREREMGENEIFMSLRVSQTWYCW